MILHILKKDWRLLWPLVGIVAATQWINAALWFSLAHFKEPRGLLIFAQLFALAVFLGSATLITCVVQQDVLPGVSQDWLVRPIRRGDMVCAKLLFVIVSVHG